MQTIYKLGLLITAIILLPVVSFAQPMKIVILPFELAPNSSLNNVQEFGEDFAVLLSLQFHFAPETDSIPYTEWTSQLSEALTMDTLASQFKLEEFTTLIPNNALKDYFKELEVDYIVIGSLTINSQQLLVRSKLLQVHSNYSTDDMYIQSKANYQIIKPAPEFRTDLSAFQSKLPDSRYDALHDLFKQQYATIHGSQPLPNTVPEHEVEVMLGIDLTQGMEIPIEALKRSLLNVMQSFTGTEPRWNFKIGIMTFAEPANDPTIQILPFTNLYAQLDQFMQLQYIQPGITERVSINKVLEKLINVPEWSTHVSAQRMAFILTDSLIDHVSPDDALFEKARHYGIKTNIIQCASLSQETELHWQSKLAQTGGSLSFLTYETQVRMNNHPVRIYYHGKDNGSVYIQRAETYVSNWGEPILMDNNLFNMNREDEVDTFSELYTYLVSKNFQMAANAASFYNHVDTNLDYLLSNQVTKSIPRLQSQDYQNYRISDANSNFVIQLGFDLIEPERTNPNSIHAHRATRRFILTGEIVPNTNDLIGFTLDPSTITLESPTFLLDWSKDRAQAIRIREYVVRSFEEIKYYPNIYASQGLFSPYRWFFEVYIR